MLTAYLIGAFLFFLVAIAGCIMEKTMPSLIKLVVGVALWPLTLMVVVFDNC